MKTICFFILIFIFSISMSFAQNTTLFSGYPAVIQLIKPARIDWNSHPLAKKYKEQIEKSHRNGINFAGKYILSGFSCGNECFRFAIIDAELGTVFFPEILQKIKYNPQPTTAQNLIVFKADSELLIINFSETKKEIKKDSVQTYYKWIGNELIKISDLEIEKKIAGKILKPEFNFSVSKLKGETDVPLLFPMEIPEPKFLPKVVAMEEGSTELALYLNVINSSKTEYDLSIDLTRGCNGRPNCNYGHINGKKNPSKTPINTTSVEFNSQKAQSITLSNGISGFYIPAPDDPKATRGAQVIWLDGKGNQYAVSLKRGSKENIVFLANSMINSSSSD